MMKKFNINKPNIIPLKKSKRKEYELIYDNVNIQSNISTNIELHKLRNYEEAFKHFTKGCKINCLESKFWLSLYQTKKIVKQIHTNYFEELVRYNHAPTLHQLAKLESNLTTKINILNKSCILNNLKSIRTLGILFLNNNNNDEGIRLLRYAANNGCMKSQNILKKL